MNLSYIAYKNVKFHARQYLSYFLSCTFAVWLFFQYVSLLFHPILQEKVVPKQFVMLMYLIQGFIVLFSFLFISYTQSAFLRNRKKDIGLFQILGMDVGHITRLLFWENMLIGSASILLGIGLGIITSKLFFLIVTRVLELPRIIPFHFSLYALMVTVLLFLFLFGSISLRNYLFIRRVSIAELFRQVVKPKKAPTFSIIWLLLACCALSIAYVLMWQTPANELMWRMPIIFICMIVGTYLLFTQISVAIVEKLLKTKSFFYRGKNLFILSELRFRLKDYAKILFLVTILSSAVLSSVGVSFTYYVDAERLAAEQSPYHLNIVGEPGGVTPQVVKQETRKHGFSITGEWHLPFINLSNQSIVGLPRMSYLTSVSTYNQLLTNKNLPPIKLSKDEALFARSSGIWRDGMVSIPEHVVQIGKQKVRIQREFHGTIFNESIVTTNLLVVSDQVFQQLQKEFSKQQLLVHAYRFSDWKGSHSLLTDLIQWIEEKENRTIYPYETLNGTAITHQLLKEIFAPLMFMSLLIGILFFLASGSILYFRLFTEVDYDQKQMNVLDKLGISKKEVKGILSWQVRLLFYLPFFVSIIHSAFALRLFSQLFDQPVWSTYMIIVGGYFIVYSLYYFWTRKNYIQAVINPLHKV